MLLSIKGLVPTGVRRTADGPRLQWQIDGKIVESDLDRFRPVLVSRGDDPQTINLTWQDVGDLPLADDPFFSTSIKRATALEDAAQQFRTDSSILSGAAARADNLPFAGAVVHMGRTGSTLIHRVLGSTGKIQSLSEIVPLVRTIEATKNWPEQARNTTVRDMLAVYRRPRHPGQRQFVTKIGSAYLLPEFRGAFPDVPWVFSYRDPVEVMVSAMEKPTGLIRAWYKNRTSVSRRIGVPRVNDPGMSPPEFVAHLMRRVCRSVVEAAEATPPGLFLAVNYSRLPDAIWDVIAPHFRIDLTDEDKAQMREQSRYSSKSTTVTEFKPDVERKKAKATPGMHRLAERIVAPVYEKVLALPQA